MRMLLPNYVKVLFAQGARIFANLLSCLVLMGIFFATNVSRVLKSVNSVNMKG